MPGYYYVSAIAVFAVIFLWKRNLPLSLLIAYMFLVLAYTILTRTATPNVRAEFIPFWSYRAIAGAIYSPVSRLTLFLQIIANIVMFVPIGALAGRLFKWKGILIGCSFSAVIEVTQLLTHHGLFEFDDIIHNTLGTAIGVGIYFWVRHTRDTRTRSKR